MINETIIEGIVVREPWKFMEDLFFRMVIYRDIDQPSKKLDPAPSPTIKYEAARETARRLFSG